MMLRARLVGAVFGVLVFGLSSALLSQEAPPGPPADEELPAEPQGVEVLARGPVHEAFATATSDPVAPKPVPKQPPPALEELPPDEKPEGSVVWIGGYWAWDDERNDFLWVSGVWRTPPPGKGWVSGYWRQEGTGWQWVPGFWVVEAKEDAKQEVTYLPPPPATPDVAPPGQPPSAESFYVPGHWVWNGSSYAWRAGYWAKVQPHYVWVPAHYRWTPSGYVFIPGYWDLAVARRGVLYAPVIVDPAVVGATFVYTPTYVVRETVVVDSLFIRPATCHYYFGDYYSVAYRDLGFESCIVCSRRRYDPIIVSERYQHRHVPDWERTRINIYVDRCAGRAPCPPRTLKQQVVVKKNVTKVNVTQINQTIVNNPTTVNPVNVPNNEVLVPAKKLAADKGTRTVALDQAARSEAKEQAQTLQKVAAERKQTEVAVPASVQRQPRSATLNVPKPQPVAARPSAASPPPSGAAKPPSAAATKPASAAAAPAASASKPAASRRSESSARPSAAKPVTGKPVASKPLAARPEAARPVAGKPAAETPPPASSLPPTIRATGTNSPRTTRAPAAKPNPTPPAPSSRAGKPTPAASPPAKPTVTRPSQGAGTPVNAARPTLPPGPSVPPPGTAAKPLESRPGTKPTTSPRPTAPPSSGSRPLVTPPASRPATKPAAKDKDKKKKAADERP